ncbi:MAG TPA: hypothetical protein PK079_19290 [Leptospiraceae bacterium]|nr:hypothetical protein [Leptospiraceae bacterium]HMW05608.1 hypothetical protein [Leptospiraceae bacterium]HMX34379.1 hypothetical protein [Leptospiraceae bacterium]HMY31117.1 hypothetical protein [Leptospiraceae bacterium]HMZ63700.1 hypothetical protein [Leptospiraceae bacterium]
MKKNIFFKLIVLTYYCLVLYNCKPQELKIENIELCENFASDGVCREKLDNSHTYEIKINKNKKYETWEALSNYMYFHSRQTPGFIVRFNRKFTLTERETLHKTYKAKYEFYGSSGIVEGFEIGDDWIGSFQYLGSIVKDRQRHFKEEKNFPYLETVFPASIRFSFDSALAKGQAAVEVNVRLNYIE